MQNACVLYLRELFLCMYVVNTVGASQREGERDTYRKGEGGKWIKSDSTEV